MLLVVLLAFCLFGCSKGSTKEFKSYLPPESAAVGDDVQIDGSNHIQIKQADVVSVDSQEILLITYDWYFDGGGARVGSDHYLITAKQGGVSLTPDLSQVSDIKKLVTQIEAGEKIEDIQQGFILNDATLPVKLALKGNDTAIFDEDGRPVQPYAVTVEVKLES